MQTEWLRGSIPIWVWIDPTRRCNLSCSLCYTKTSHASEDMTEQSFERIITALQEAKLPNYIQFALNWRGEPTLNPGFVRMLRSIMGTNPYFPVEFHTNGTAISVEMAKAIIAIEGAFTINVSIDGGSAASHDRNRGRGTFVRTIAGLKNLLNARGAKKTPKIAIHHLDLREDVAHHDPEFVAICKRVDEVQIKIPILPDGNREAFKEEKNVQGGSLLIREWKGASASRRRPNGACFFAGNSISIAPSGDVSICLLSHSSKGVLGNVFIEPIDGLVAKANLFRERLETTGRATVDHCMTCYMEEGSSARQFSEGTRKVVKIR